MTDENEAHAFEAFSNKPDASLLPNSRKEASSVETTHESSNQPKEPLEEGPGNSSSKADTNIGSDGVPDTRESPGAEELQEKDQGKEEKSKNNQKDAKVKEQDESLLGQTGGGTLTASPSNSKAAESESAAEAKIGRATEEPQSKAQDAAPAEVYLNTPQRQGDSRSGVTSSSTTTPDDDLALAQEFSAPPHDSPSTPSKAFPKQTGPRSQDSFSPGIFLLECQTLMPCIPGSNSVNCCRLWQRLGRALTRFRGLYTG